MFYFYIPEGICFAAFVAFSCTWLHFARFQLCFSVFYPLTTEKHKSERAVYNHVKEKATKAANQIPSGI
jgi:hypothetical protein